MRVIFALGGVTRSFKCIISSSFWGGRLYGSFHRWISKHLEKSHCLM